MVQKTSKRMQQRGQKAVSDLLVAVNRDLVSQDQISLPRNLFIFLLETLRKHLDDPACMKAINFEELQHLDELFNIDSKYLTSIGGDEHTQESFSGPAEDYGDLLDLVKGEPNKDELLHLLKADVKDDPQNNTNAAVELDENNYEDLNIESEESSTETSSAPNDVDLLDENGDGESEGTESEIEEINPETEEDDENIIPNNATEDEEWKNDIMKEVMEEEGLEDTECEVEEIIPGPENKEVGEHDDYAEKCQKWKLEMEDAAAEAMGAENLTEDEDQSMDADAVENSFDSDVEVSENEYLEATEPTSKQQSDTADNWAQMEAEMMDVENYLDNALKKDVAEFGADNIKVEEKYVPEKEQIDVGKMTPCEESFKDFVENNKSEVNDENCVVKKDSFVESYLDNAMKKETETELIDRKPTTRRESYGKKSLAVVGVADMAQMELVKSGRWGTGKRLSAVEDLLVKNEEGMWQCKPCGKTAKNSGEIRLHAERHIDGLTFECNLCGRSFRSRASLAQHKWSFKGKDVKCNETKRRDSVGVKETPEEASTRKQSKSRGSVNVKQEINTEDPEVSPQMESPMIALNMNVKQESYVEMLAAQGIDIKKSAYFCNTKQSVANGSRIAHLFTEPLPFLPEGWRIRIVEVKSKEKVLKQKQYLSPTNLLFKASLGVIEYLRLEGKFSHEELMSVARSLRVENKVNKLFSSEELASAADPDPAGDTTLEQDASEGVPTDSTSNVDNSFGDESNVSEGADLGESVLTRPQVEVNASSEFDLVLSAADNIIQQYDNNLEELSSYGKEESAENNTEDQAEVSVTEDDGWRNDVMKEVMEEEGVDAETETANEKKVAAETKNKKSGKGKGVIALMAAQGVDVQMSAYLSNTLHSVNDGSKKVQQFTEAVSFLPEGWKAKTVELKENGKVVLKKHYLSPANIVFKTTLGVVEYLRLEGKITMRELLDAAKALKVGPTRLKKLFSVDAATEDEKTMDESSTQLEMNEEQNAEYQTHLNEVADEYENGPTIEGDNIEESFLTSSHVDIDSGLDNETTDMDVTDEVITDAEWNDNEWKELEDSNNHNEEEIFNENSVNNEDDEWKNDVMNEVMQEEGVESPTGQVDVKQEVKEVEQTNEQKIPICKSLIELMASQGVDVKKSAYFSTTKQAVSEGRKAAPLFTETASFLPEGWRFRTYEFKDKGKGVLLQKQYISPANVIVKKAMGVVEYLRLEGKLSFREVMDVAKSLKVSLKRLQKLFSDADETRISEDSQLVKEEITDAV